MHATAHVNEDDNIVSKMAQLWSVDPDNLKSTLKKTAFKQKGNTEITDEQLYALLIVCKEYDLNPFLKEIYAFPDKSGAVVPVVSVDGWVTIANRHENFDGIEFKYSEELVIAEKARCPCHAWVEATVSMRNRSKPVVIREFYDECYVGAFVDAQTGFVSLNSWQTHPKRRLRNKTMCQAYRIAFGFSNIYDEDEAMRIIDAQQDGGPSPRSTVVPFRGKNAIAHQPAPTVEEFFEEAEEALDEQTKAELEEYVGKLVVRCAPKRLWSTGESLIEERLNGAAKQYALDLLEKARDESEAIDKMEAIPVCDDDSQE